MIKAFTPVAPDQIHPNAGIERLRMLYAMLRGLPEEKVDLKNWREKKTGKGSFAYCDDEELVDADSCGTAGCAVGWACAYPPFKAMGLKMHSAPTYDGSPGWAAVTHFFGIEYRYAEFLFLKPEEAAHDLFSGEMRHAFRRRDGESDLALVLRRVRYYLVEAGAITQKRSDELAAEEGAAC